MWILLHKIEVNRIYCASVWLCMWPHNTSISHLPETGLSEMCFSGILPFLQPAVSSVVAMSRRNVIATAVTDCSYSSQNNYEAEYSRQEYQQVTVLNIRTRITCYYGLIYWLVSWLIIWLIKCQKIVKHVHYFPVPKEMYSDVLFYSANLSGPRQNKWKAHSWTEKQTYLLTEKATEFIN